MLSLRKAAEIPDSSESKLDAKLSIVIDEIASLRRNSQINAATTARRPPRSDIWGIIFKQDYKQNPIVAKACRKLARIFEATEEAAFSVLYSNCGVRGLTTVEASQAIVGELDEEYIKDQYADGFASIGYGRPPEAAE
jgi:hypothetical protein